MTSFTQEEIGYLRSQRLARIATVASGGQPDVVPVGYQFDGKRFLVTGFDLAATRKYRNVAAGNHKVAIVIDDFVSVDPWTPRFIRIYGTAELSGPSQDPTSAPSMCITPNRSWSWNLDARPFDHAGPSVALRRAEH